MRDNDPTQDLGLECPYDSTFHICKNDPNRFIGCCGVSPCGARKGLCPDQHLYAASFDKAYEDYIPSQACTNDNVDVAWHGCSWSTFSFIGCCAVDPCSGGCPNRELRAARLSDNSKNAEVFLGQGYDYPPEPSPTPSPSRNPVMSRSISSATAITTAAVSSFLTSYTLNPTSEADTSSVESAAPSHESHDHSNNDICVSKGGLAGIVVTVVFLVIAAIWKVCKHQSRKTREKDDDEKSDTLKDGRLPLIQQGQGVRSKATQTPDQSKHCQVQQKSQPDTFNRFNHPYIPGWGQKKPEAVQQNGYLQPPSPAIPSRSPSPRNDDALPAFPVPSGLPGVTRNRNPDSRPSFELEGSPVPVYPVITAPSPSANPNIQNDTGSPYDSVSYTIGQMRVTNGYASDRSSDTSKIGTGSSGGVRLPDSGAKFDCTRK
ncbi:hypothetical protein FVEN_g5476 [Fusarium venenatum]|uniref:Uncharacterized protein n=1 Tax=Fusarium venenatum TaxID=56646 RepID=A0A2L2U0D3_9HYPO|nr:uncharacterized protein FVRRES_08437 [Fusarium venenatum]KAG8356636.1 hypothetical protein FVEN_g5476 [Fusarium venenatum]CEI68360.1 unnamed protein product [Fusarium venenatum]